MTTIKLTLVLLAAAAAGALSTFPYAAAQRGWRIGEWYTLPMRKPVLIVTFASMALVLGAALTVILSGRASWWLLLGLAASNFIGGATLVALVRGWSGPVFMLVAPALALSAFLIN